jgi:hypothetical protein
MDRATADFAGFHPKTSGSAILALENHFSAQQQSLL